MISVRCIDNKDLKQSFRARKWWNRDEKKVWSHLWCFKPWANVPRLTPLEAGVLSVNRGSGTWGWWPVPSPDYHSLPFPESAVWERVNSWVWGIMVFFCFVLLDLMHRKMPRTSNNYSKTTLLPSHGRSRRAGAQTHCRAGAVAVRWEKQKPMIRNFLRNLKHSVALSRMGEGPPWKSLTCFL